MKIILLSYQLKAILAAQGSGHAMSCVPCCKSLTVVHTGLELFLTKSCFDLEIFTTFYFVIFLQNLSSHFPFLCHPTLFAEQTAGLLEMAWRNRVCVAASSFSCGYLTKAMHSVSTYLISKLFRIFTMSITNCYELLVPG